MAITDEGTIAHTDDIQQSSAFLAAGRWDNAIQIQKGSRTIVGTIVLRLDPPTTNPRMISCDIFADIGIEGAVPKLGGRRDWAYSLVGDLAQARIADHQLTAPCDVSAVQKGGHDDLNHKATLVAKIDPDGTLKSVEIHMMSQRHGAWETVARLNSDHFSESDTMMMRRLRLRVVMTQQVEDNPQMVTAIHMLADANSPLGITRTLAEDGIAADVVIEKAAGVLSGLTIEPTTGHYQEHVERLIPYVGSYFQDTAPDPVNDWSHTFVFATHDPGNPSHNERELPNYGESFGLGTALSRFNSRHGAVINASSLANETADAPDSITDPTERLAYMFRFTAIHELSHLLNIPHAWERAMGHRMLGQSDPGAATWSNYPTAHPDGAEAFTQFGTLSQPDNHVIQSKRAKAFYTNFENRFDDVERSFVHHAPFSHIAQGGRTFLDREIPAPSFKKPNDTGLNLSIMVASGGGLEPIDFMKLFNFYADDALNDGLAQNTTLYEYPVVPAWIVLRDGKTPVPSNPRYFDFQTQSGAVQVNVTSADGRHVANQRNVITYSSLGQPDPVPGAFSSTFAHELELAAAKIAPPPLPNPAAGLVAVPFPWIGRSLLHWQMNHAPEKLGVQASFRSAKDTYYSQRVEFDFSGGCASPDRIHRKPLARNAHDFYASRCATGLQKLFARHDEQDVRLDMHAHPSTR